MNDLLKKLQQDTEASLKDLTAWREMIERVDALDRRVTLTEGDTLWRRVDAQERIIKALVKTHSDHANAIHVLLNVCSVELKTFPPGGKGDELPGDPCDETCDHPDKAS